MKRRSFAFVLAAALSAAPAFAQGVVWSVDPVHSTAQFTARHFGIVPVVGTIPITSASVTISPGTQIPTSVVAILDAAKVDTHFAMRDGDLRSEHFFDVASTPEIRFVSTKIDGTDPKHFTITGDLTMHGQTRPVTLNAQVVTSGTTPRGRSVAAYAAAATIDRTQWGMTYGPDIVGNDVDLAINVEADSP